MGAGYRNRQRIRDCGILPPPPRGDDGVSYQ
jgi:hypothetical protein